MIIIVEVDKDGPNAQLTLQINNADNSLSIKRLLLSLLRMQKWHLISEQCDLNQCTLGVNDVQSKMFFKMSLCTQLRMLRLRCDCSHLMSFNDFNHLIFNWVYNYMYF